MDASFWRHSWVLILSALVISTSLSGRASELDRFHAPAAVRVGNETLHLNGTGERTYSILGIPIYIACLYLRHLSRDAKEIIQSPETKLLTLRFQHDVDADRARKAWREGLERNCKPPCRLDPGDLNRFLAGVPDIHRNDMYSVLFTQTGATVALNGRRMGTISQPMFAQAMLATFLGPEPASPTLKQGLLQGGPGQGGPGMLQGGRTVQP